MGLTIFAIAFAVRLVHVSQIREAPFFGVLLGDARAYDEWAQRLAQGDWLGDDVFYQAPLYPYLLGALYAIAGRDLLLVRLVQAVIGSLSCVLVAWAGCRLVSRRAGVIAGLGMALYAPAIFSDALLQKSVLDVFFVSLALWLLTGLICDPGRAPGWFWLGLAVGALGLTRENALVLIPVVFVWAVARRAAGPHGAADRMRSVRTAGVFVLGVAVILVPVAVRNSVVGDGFYLTTSQFGPNFYIGNNPHADGTYLSLRSGRGDPEYEREDATALAEEATGRRLTPAEVSSYWTGRALAYIRAEPVAWVKLLGRKAALLWNRSEMLDTESQESHAEWSAPLRIAGRVAHFGVLVPLAVLGLILTWPLRERLVVLYAIAAAYAATVVVFYVSARYRYPLVPFLWLFAAGGLAGLRRFLQTGAVRARVAALVTALGAAAVFVNWPMLSPDVMRAITEHNLGAALQSEGKLDEAIEHYRRAIALRSDYAPAYNNMGAALRANGDVAEAIASYERALVLRPEYPEARYNLANALLDHGRPEEAIEHFRRALRSRPGSADIHNNLGIALAGAGRSGEAVAAFREAVRLDPGSSSAHRNLGDALTSDGRHEEAIEYLRRAVQLDPADGAGHYDLATVLLETDRFSEAADRFRAALQLMPESAEAYNNLGIALASQGKLAEAVDQFQHALRLQPAFLEAQRNLTAVRTFQPVK